MTTQKKTQQEKLHRLVTHSVWLGLVDHGDPRYWDEEYAEYQADNRRVPEQWVFATPDPGDVVRVYSNGTIEKYDNAEISLSELEGMAVNVISALAKAYQVEADNS